MLSVLASWIVILGISLILGYGVIHYCYRSCRNVLGQWDVYIVCGLMLTNVYAESFSLFYKVGAKACLILTVIGILLAIIYHISTRGDCWNEIRKLKEISIYQWIAVFFTSLATLAWTVGYPQHYDTSLYHFQAIKWIEEYGVVPGLGNLHNRFAYNSAFMPLQALFSFEWLIGQSLHSVNGFLCCFFLVYALVTNRIWKREKLKISDLLKIATFIYISYNRTTISSPSSDTLTMLLVLYICTKWSEFAEKDIEDVLPYGFLCVLCVYAISVKLSAVACIVLVIWPAVQMIKHRRGKAIIGNLLLGVIIVTPCLARNVIISGYLLYPYPQIDLFNVDWKMPASVLTYDSREIVVWGRRVFDVAAYEKPIWKWFPTWFLNSSPGIIVVGAVGVIGWIMLFTIRLIREKKFDIKKDILGIYGIIAVISWLFSAPLIRYGMVYLMIPGCMVLGYIIEKTTVKWEKLINIILLIYLIPTVSIYVAKIDDIKDSPTYFQEDYEWKLTVNSEIHSGVRIWFPAEGDQSSADVFPCVPYRAMVEKLELRGESLETGFRMKDEYQGLHINEYGYEW